MAAVVLPLWRHALRRDPTDPGWPERDRVIIAHEQGDSLQRALLQLLEDRKLPTRPRGPGNTPHHASLRSPEQLLGHAVGLATAEQLLARHFNRLGHIVVDHWTYVLVDARDLASDGLRELCTRAARRGLRKLVVLCAYQPLPVPADWHVPEPIDAADPLALVGAIGAAQRESRRPTLIRYHTEERHGELLEDRTAALEARCARDELVERGAVLTHQWQREFRRYAAAHPHLAAEFRRRQRSTLPLDWSLRLTGLLEGIAEQPCRSATPDARILATFKVALPELIDISSDLTLNDGLAAHQAWLPYCLLRLQRIDAMLPVVSAAAVLRRHVIFAFAPASMATGRGHSRCCGCRAAQALHEIADLDVWHCADALEEVWAWRAAIERCAGTSALLLSASPRVTRSISNDEDPSRGGYIAREASGQACAALVARGGELHAALAAQQILSLKSIAVRVVSLPCHGAFARQSAAYRRRVLPSELPHVQAHQISGYCLEQDLAHPSIRRPHEQPNEPLPTAQQLVVAVEARLAATATTTD
jgi:transketolase